LDTNELALAARALFTQPPFRRLISEGLKAVYGDAGGIATGVCYDDTKIKMEGFSADSGRMMVEAVVGLCTPERPNAQVDVEVNGTGFCLTLVGPPVTDRYRWTVARRDSVAPEGRGNVTVSVDLEISLEGALSGEIPVDLGSATAEAEGAYRRGYHQAVAMLADLLRRRQLTADELDAWVEGNGMRWRKDVTLERRIVAPSI
jgi:hypothetical protein